MIIIEQALKLAELQRTSMAEEQIIRSYKKDFDDAVFNCKKLGLGKMNILDIGCGIAGWECFTSKEEKIYLIDKTQIDKEIYYGFKPKTSFYSSIKLAKENLIANGIKKENIFTHEADNTIPFNENFDLIVSFISCGFHYPIETYLNQIYEKLNIGGVLIIDIRKGTNGLEIASNKFGNYKIISENLKYNRVVFVR